MTPQPLNVTGRVDGATAANLAPHVAAAATTSGFKVKSPVPGTLMLSRTFRPIWAKLTGAGLIALGVAIGATGAGPGIWMIVIIGVACIVFVRGSETISLVVTDDAGGAAVTATGTADDGLREFVQGLLEA